MFAFLLSLNNVTVAVFIAGAETQTLPVVLFQMAKFEVTPAMAALGCPVDPYVVYPLRTDPAVGSGDESEPDEIACRVREVLGETAAPWEVVSRTGSVAHELRAIARDRHVDVLVIGKPRRSLRHFFRTLAGRLTIQVRASIPINTPGDMKAYRLRGTAKMPSFDVAGLEMTSVEAKVRYTDGVLELNEEQVEVGPGTVVYIEPGTRHRLSSSEGVRTVVFGVPALHPEDEYFDYAKKVQKALHDAGVRSHLDSRAETLKYRVAEGASMKVPYMLVVGKREAEQGTVAVNVRGAGKEQKPNAVQLDDFVRRVVEENRTRSLVLAAHA